MTEGLKVNFATVNITSLPQIHHNRNKEKEGNADLDIKTQEKKEQEAKNETSDE